ncbi:MAG: ion channel [Chitinophagaceae bacterium]
MAFKSFYTKVKDENNTGFGSNSSYNAGRFINKDGVANVKKTGIGFLRRYSLYHTMLSLPRWKFLFSIFSFFVIINLVFATVYYLIGIDELHGISAGSPFFNFAEAFFFSSQTFTTVGYGRISPSSFLTSTIAAMEALTGLLSFAVVTGLFYGRFSRPRTFLRFSHNMVIGPYKDITGLMFRMVPYKNNQLTEVETKLTLAMELEENGSLVNKFYTLDLEISKLNSLTLSWTIVHPINEVSPLYNLSREDLENIKIEFIAYVKAFDEAFSNTVISRTSYTGQEILFGAKFTMMYEADRKGKSTVLYLDRLNETEKAPIAARVSAEYKTEMSG